MRRILLAAMIAALYATAALADVVHLKSGGRIEGRVTEEGDVYRIETGYGTITVRRDEVDRIEKKDFTPPDQPVLKKARPKLRDSFAHPFYGFKIYLPAGWAKGPDKKPREVNFYGPKEQLYTPRVDLTVNATQMELGQFVGALKRQYAKEYPDVVFQAEETLSVRGREGASFLVAFTDGGVRMRSLWTCVRLENRTYTAGFSCTEAWFDKYYAAVDASMRSLRLYPLPTAPMEQRQQFDQLYRQGYSLHKEGKTADALKAFARAAELVPEFPDIHAIVGQLRAKLGNYADAEAAYRKAMELDSEDYEYAFNLGVILLQQQKFDGAIDALSKAVKADPEREPALTNLGVAWLAKEMPEKARDTLKKAVLADPESAPAHFNLGVAWEHLGRKKEAEAEFKEALKIDPKHDGAKLGLERLKKN